MRFPSPSHLAAAFRQQPDAVRADLEELCGDDLKRLVREYRKTFALEGNESALFELSIRWITIYAGTRRPEKLADFAHRQSMWKEFKYFLLLAWSKLVLWNPQWPGADHGSIAGGPSWVEDQADAVSGSLPCEQYDVKVFCRPADRVAGDLVDWVNGKGASWLIFADALGHGRGAFLIAQGLRCVWKKHVAQLSPEPEEVLGTVHALMVELWPPGVFVQTTLARFDASGRMTLASAGGSFLFALSDDETEVKFEGLRGDMMGVDFGRAAEYDRQVRDLRCGEEVMLASDGLCDQFGDRPTFLLQLSKRPAGATHETLYERTERLITEALRGAEQLDDITFVSIRLKRDLGPAYPTGVEGPADVGQPLTEAPHNDDASLVDRYLAGDQAAERELYERFRVVASRVVSTLLGAARSAEWPDVCQVALIRLFAKVATWRGRCPLEAWAAVVAARVTVDAMGSREPSSMSLETVADVVDPSPPSDPAVVECIEKRIATFKPDWRLAFQLRKEGYTNEEIAERLGRSVRSIQLWFREMYERLVSCLDR